MRRTFSRLVWFVLGVTLALVFLECALRFLPVSMGRHRTDQFERWPLQNLEPHLKHSYSISWSMQNAQRGTTNNYGHISPFDYKKGSRPLFVIGDSFIESLMNEHADTLQDQLAQKIGAQESVYGLGVSGLSASDYVALSRLARDEFNPVAAIFLMTDGDFSESLGYSLGNYYLEPDGDALKLSYAPMRDVSLAKKMRRAIGEIALYRYFLVNLQFSLDKVTEAFQRDAVAALQPQLAEKKIAASRKVADWVLAELPKSLGLPPECVVFLMDSDRYAIYKPELASKRKDDPQVRIYFIEQAQKQGFKVSDLESVFRQRYQRERIKFDHYPIDRHWNRVGHGVGAEEAYRLLFDRDQQPSCLAGKQAGQ
jgi:hypothetical protein